MSLDYIPVNIPHVTGEDIDYVRQAMIEGWISGEGKYVAEFEESMANLCDRKYAIAVSNGSVALDLVIEALGIGPGDEVILPSFTIISCVSQILRNGATPVFVDALPDTWNMDVSQVEKLITPRTKAIMAVHIYGLPVDMDPLIAIAQKNGIAVIEDAAEAHGLKYKNRVAGSMGLVSTFSFYANKNITCGEGGMILTDDEVLGQKFKSLRNLAFDPERRFVHYELGWNARMSSLQAALGASQMKRLDRILGHRKKIAGQYQEALAGLQGLRLPLEKTDYSENDYWVFGIVLDQDSDVSRDRVVRELEDEGIATRPFFHPLHKQPVLGRLGYMDEPKHLPVSEHLGARGFYIPNGLGMTEDQIRKTCDIVSKILKTWRDLK